MTAWENRLIFSKSYDKEFGLNYDGKMRGYTDEAIELLKTGKVDVISLDHDLGDDERGTGNDVILWIEEAVITQKFTPPEIRVHSANSAARAKMEAGIQTINKFRSKNR